MNEDDIEKISYLDLYEILDISKDTYDKKKLKKNYKKLVLCLHPDRNNGESEAFEVVNLAYTILKDKYLKKTYDKKRKEYLNSKDFNSLKSQNDNINLNSNIPDNEDDAKQKFKVLEEELNKKHNFNSKDLDVISSSELAKRLQNLTFSRTNFDDNYKNTIEKVHYNKEDFNTAFLNNSSREAVSTREITAYNSSDMQISNYTNINNFDLYSNNAESTTSYGALNSAFKNNVPTNVTNDYNTHNYITNDDIQKYNRKMSEHINAIRNNN
jgi:curved DNA-binding protein CbpA